MSDPVVSMTAWHVRLVPGPTPGPDERGVSFKHAHTPSIYTHDLDQAFGPITYAMDVIEAATRLCAEGVKKGTRDPALFHLSGLIATRHDYADVAVAYLQYAANGAPSAAYFSDLADVLTQYGRGADAITAALTALVLTRSEPSSYRRLGLALARNGTFNAAIAAYLEALRLDSGDPATLGGLGALYAMRARWSEAVAFYEEALKLDDRDRDLHCGLGQTWAGCSQWRRALCCFQKAVELDPAHVRSLVGIGEMQFRLNQIDAAVETFRFALTIEPTSIVASHHLVCALELLGRTRETPDAWFALAEALQMKNRYVAAAHCYREVLRQNVNCLQAILRLAHVYIACGEPAQAQCCLDTKLALHCHHPMTHVDRATVFHLLGQAERGWDEFASYYDLRGSVRRAYEQPVWDGSPLNGKTILLWTSDGRGDVIQFLRYISLVERCGGRIVVECNHAGLVPFIRRMSGVKLVTVPGAPLPSFDVHAPLTFLPAFVPYARSFGGDLVPYITVDPELADAWRRRLAPDGRPLIGLSWGGELSVAPSRFLPLAAFATLGDVSDLRFISLQHGPQAAELLVPPPGLRIEEQMNANSSIDDAAALIVNLDLVISVDTMIAHLAGALGRPVWTLLRYATNWRWRSEGNRTAWYPTMRLFRQSELGDWTESLASVRAAFFAFFALNDDAHDSARRRFE